MAFFYSLEFDCISFSGGSDGKESACIVGDLGSIPGLGRSPGEGNGYPLQYSGLENSMDCVVHGIAKSWTPLSYFHSYFHLYFNHMASVQGQMFTASMFWPTESQRKLYLRLCRGRSSSVC